MIDQEEASEEIELAITDQVSDLENPEKNITNQDLNDQSHGEGLRSKLIKYGSVPVCVWFFLAGMDLIGTSAKVLGSRSTAGYFDVVDDPVGSVCLGELFTVAVQSSSTSTSVIISLVGAGELSLNLAIFMIFGANLGTTITNNLIALWWLKNKNDDAAGFATGFATSAMHDIFNVWSLILSSILQAAFNFYPIVTGIMTRDINENSEASEDADIGKVITAEPVDMIIKAHKDNIKAMTKNPQLTGCYSLSTCESGILCELDESWAGSLAFALGLATLCVSLVYLTKNLRAILVGPVMDNFKKLLKIHPALNLMLGCALTVMMQSSSVVTSVLTTLTMERYIDRDEMLPLMIGSNWGTCITGIIAAAAAESHKKEAMMAALSHLLFNLIGTVSYIHSKVRNQLFFKPAEKIEALVESKPLLYSVLYLIGFFVVLPSTGLSISLAVDSKNENIDPQFNATSAICP